MTYLSIIRKFIFTALLGTCVTLFASTILANEIVPVSSICPPSSAAAAAHAQKIRQLVSSYYDWINYMGNPKNPVTIDQVSKHCALNMQFYTNGKLVGNGENKFFQNRVNAVRQKYKLLQVKLPLQEVLVEDNKAAVNYIVTLTDQDGTTHDLAYIALIQFNKAGKITRYYEVLNNVDPVVSS